MRVLSIFKSIFKFRDDGSSPAFLNTFIVISTYLLMTVFYVREFLCLAPEQRQDWEYCLNLFVNTYGVSTITYILGVIVQNFASIKKGDPMFGETAWLLLLGFTYATFYVLFIPRHYGLNIFLIVFTLFIVLYASHCIFKIAESGQAKANNIDHRGIT